MDFQNEIDDYLKQNISALVDDLPIDSRFKLLVDATKSIVSFRDSYYIYKFQKLIGKISEIEISENIKLSDRLFNGAKAQENALRIINVIDKVDTDLKIDYMKNAIRAYLLQLIDEKTFFRMLKIIGDVLNEDLEFLRDNVQNKEIVWSTEVQALERNGLLLQFTFDSAKSVEEQKYVITSFGYELDKNVLSLLDDERQKWYKNNPTRVTTPPKVPQYWNKR